jgi:hypothetical protein
MGPHMAVSAPGALFRRALALFAGVAATTWGAAAHAQATSLPLPLAWNYGEHDTTRSLALGGAVKALGSGTTAVLTNPANLTLTRAYHIEALAQLTPEASRQVYGGAIMDSLTGKLAGGVGVFGGFMDPQGVDRSSIDVRLALSYGLGDRVFLGLGGRYLKLNQGGIGPFGDSPVSGGLKNADGARGPVFENITFDAGLTLRATEGLHIGVHGQNLTFAGHGFLPSTVGGGIGYGTKDFSLEVDGVADFHSYQSIAARVMAGGEYLIAGHVPLRAGYRWDQGADMHFASLGLGYVAREFSVEVSARRGIADVAPTQIVVGLAYFLESSGLLPVPPPQ